MKQGNFIKRLLRLSFLLCACLCFAVGCATATSLKDQDPYDESGFDAAEQGSTNIYMPLEVDEDMTIDGKLDEDRWQEKNWFTFHDSGVTVGVTTSLSDLGVYVGLSTDDRAIYYNSSRDIYINSSFELYVDRIDSTEKSENTLQIRMDYENIETYFGYMVEGTAYGWKKQYRPLFGEMYVEGELNTGSADGMTAEMFISWEALGYDMDAEDFAAPAGVRIYPAYSKASGEDTTAREAWCINNAGYDDVSQFWKFGKDGFAETDAEDAVIGDSPFVRVKSSGWDRSVENIVRSTQGGERYIFFTDKRSETPGSADCYVFTAKINFKNNIQDAWPRMGVILASDDTNMYSYMLQIWDDTSAKVNGEFFERNFFGSTWKMMDTISIDTGFQAKDGVRMTGVKYGKMLYVFVGGADAEKYGGEFVAFRSFNDIEGAAVPGFVTMGCEVEYSDYEMSVDADLIETVLSRGNVSFLKAESSAGGMLSGYESAYVKGQDSVANIKISANDGYYLKSITVNGENKLAQVKNGTLAVTMDKDEMLVKAQFEKIEGTLYKASGKISLSESMQIANVEIIAQAQFGDGIIILRPYIFMSGSEYRVEMQVPNGTYDYLFFYEGEEVKVSQFIVRDADTEIPELGVNAQTVYGNGKGGSQSVGEWNTVKDPVEIRVSATTGERNQFIFNSQVGNTNQFIYETIVKTDGSHVEGETWPFAGIVLQNTAGGANYRMIVHVRAGAETENSEWAKRNTLICWYVGDTDQRVEEKSPFYEGSRPMDENGTKITIVRDGVNLYVFVNDAFIVNYNVGFTADMKTDVGLSTGGGSIATFTGMRYSEDAEEIAEYIALAEKPVTDVTVPQNGKYLLSEQKAAEFYATGTFEHSIGNAWGTAGYNLLIGSDEYSIFAYFDTAANNDTNFMVIHNSLPWNYRHYWQAGANMPYSGQTAHTFSIAIKGGTLYLELTQKNADGEDVTVRRAVTSDTAPGWGGDGDQNSYYTALFGNGEKQISLGCQDGSAKVKYFSVSFESTVIDAFIENFSN